MGREEDHDMVARIRQAARVDEAVTARVVANVLAQTAEDGSRAGGRHRNWRFAAVTAMLVAIVVGGVWWTGSAPPVGRTSVRMVTTTGLQVHAGEGRTSAALVTTMSREVVSVTSDGGTRVIFSTPGVSPVAPPGTLLLIAGEDAR